MKTPVDSVSLRLLVKYKHFVEALPPFIAEARTLLNRPKLHEDVQFRDWRHRLEDLLQRVSAEGYPVNSKVATRSFDRRNTYGDGPAPDSDRLAAYNRELRDTVVELKTIVEHYAILGKPKRHLPSLTPAWLWNNVPHHQWALFLSALATALATAFWIAVSLCRSSLLEKLWHSSP